MDLTLIIWLAVLLAVFAYLWYKGHLLRFAGYVRATRDELKRCNWPNRQELTESTFVVMVSIALLGLFTFGADFVISLVVNAINTLR